jgi:hypothetical protein
VRYLNGFLALLMALFATVQYNDPDALFWVAIYLATAAWAAVAAVRPSVFTQATVRGALALTLGTAIVFMVVFWPQDAFWWRQDVWWESEAAREGMGLMITTAVIAIVFATAYRLGRHRIADP